jgi:hypothetical protein
MWLSLKLNVLLGAFCVYTDLRNNITCRERYCRPGDVQKLPCCPLDRHNLERKIPETVSEQSIKQRTIIGIPLYINRCARQQNRLHTKVSYRGIGRGGDLSYLVVPRDYVG